jgi:hypothetical protein
MNQTKRIKQLEDALRWYAGSLSPEDRLNDNGDKATAALSSPQKPDDQPAPFELSALHRVADDLALALNWAMEMRPSPCRCVEFATPPHVCLGHAALAAYLSLTQPTTTEQSLLEHHNL